MDQISATREEAPLDVGEIPSELSHPLTIRRWRHPCDDDSSRLQIDHEEHEIPNQTAPCDDFYSEKVSRGDGSPVRFKKRSPCGFPQRCRVHPVLEKDSLDCVSTDLESQIVECPFDSGVTPLGIVSSHLEDQPFDLRRFPRPTRSTLLGPIVLLRDEFPVPSKQRIGGDERADLNELSTTHFLRSLSETPTLNIREAKALSAQLLSKGPVLFLEVFDHALLGSIHPASENQRECLKR